MLIDTHCHLDWDSYQGDLEGVLTRAREVGVEKLVTIGTDLERNRKAKLIAKQYGAIMRCAGLHPDVVLEDGFDLQKMNIWLKELEEDLVDEKVVGIGECGLDYYAIARKTTDAKEVVSFKEIQKELFERQILLAVQEGLPLSLHVRDDGEEAYWDTLELLVEYFDVQAGEREYLFSLPDLQAHYELETPQGTKGLNIAEKKINGVLHCVSGPIDYVKKAMDLGFMIGACGNLSYKNAESLRDILREVPLSMIVLETDAPFLAPGVHRGQRNEPAFMIETAKVVAEVKGVSLQEVAKVTTENAHKLFKFNG